MYSTLAKAWENADMFGSRPYTWNDYKHEMERWLGEEIFGSCQWHDLGESEIYT